MNRSEQIGKLATALAKAQGAMDDAVKDSSNPAFRSKYANLAAVREAIRAPLSQNGLAYVQLPSFDGDMVHVETVLMHGESGEFISHVMSIPVVQKTAHGVGSATTYARRFSLMAVAGIAPDEDDDGNAASDRSAPVRQYEPRKPAPPKQEPADTRPVAEALGDEIPHQHPKEAPSTTAGNTQQAPANTAREGAGATRIADKIPEVPPTRDPVPGVGQFNNQQDEWKQRELAVRSKREADKALKALAAIRDDIGAADIAHVNARYAKWVKDAEKVKGQFVGDDVKRVADAVRAFKAKLADVTPHDEDGVVTEGAD